MADTWEELVDYLDGLDAFVETVLMPEYTRGVRRKSNPEHKRITAAIGRARKRGDHAAVRALRMQQRRLPGLDPYDPRALVYVAAGVLLPSDAQRPAQIG